MNLHENKDAFAAAIQLASTPKQEGGLGIKQIYIEKITGSAGRLSSFQNARSQKSLCSKAALHCQRHTCSGTVFQRTLTLP